MGLLPTSRTTGLQTWGSLVERPLTHLGAHGDSSRLAVRSHSGNRNEQVVRAPATQWTAHRHSANSSISDGVCQLAHHWGPPPPQRPSQGKDHFRRLPPRACVACGSPASTFLPFALVQCVRVWTWPGGQSRCGAATRVSRARYCILHLLMHPVATGDGQQACARARVHPELRRRLSRIGPARSSFFKGFVGPARCEF